MEKEKQMKTKNFDRRIHMAKINDIRFLAQETAKEVSGSHGTGCGIWTRHPGCTVIFFGHTFNPRTASGRCGLRRNGSVE